MKAGLRIVAFLIGQIIIYCAQENPRLNREVKHQIRFGINIYCGILGDNWIKI